MLNKVQDVVVATKNQNNILGSFARNFFQSFSEKD